MRSKGPTLYEAAQHPLGRRVRLGGLLARSRALERIRLSPETANLSEMRRLAAALLANGCEVFALTYHSPSLEPGYTPYVRTAGDLENFIATVHDFCAWFIDEGGGQFGSLSHLETILLAPPKGSLRT
jgi:hypothetical protein